MMDTLNVVYGARQDRKMQLDVYQPTGPTNYRTAILLFHGGGFRQGDRKMLQPQCARLAARGFTAIAVEYRLINDVDVTWPAPLHDVKGAIAWTRAHAGEIGIDPGKIVLQGHSAGALLSLMAVGTVGKPEFRPPFELEAPEAQVAALIPYYPPVRLALRPMPVVPPNRPPTPESMAQMLKAVYASDGTVPASMLFGPAATEEKATAASPIHYVSEAFPPTLIFHGTADRLVAPAASLKLFEALQSAGVVAELHIIAGADHAFDATPSLYEACAAVTEAFLYRYLVNPSGFAEEEARHNPFAAIARARA